MTADSTIAFWGVLNDKVLRFRLDGSLACLFLSEDGLQHPALVLLCFLLPIVMLTCLRFLRPRNVKRDHIHTRAALQALVAVVVPTCSLWPTRYIELAGVIRSSINIPLEVIIRDMINGVIEFRNPSDDLADLVGSGAIVNGHTIRINIGWKWWIKCLEWWMLPKAPTEQSKLNYSPLRWPRHSLGLSGWSHCNIPAANHLAISPSPFALAPSTPCTLFCLDCLPCSRIPTLDASSKVTLEFTTFSATLYMLSTAQIISAIPFMISERPRRWPRPIVSVLNQLTTSHGPDIIIDSISNVSVDYERALRHMYKSISGEQRIREAWVTFLGDKAWRREMFLVALEAALVRRGWLERWAVQVTVK